MKVVQAEMRDSGRVMEIITRCKHQMREAGSDQWDDLYPAAAMVEQDIRTKSLFVLVDESECIGAVCLNEKQSPEYAALQWRYPGPALVVHRLCVDPAKQGSGAARTLMDFAERFAATNGYPAIRLDTYTGNPRALLLYGRRGYHRAGQVSFPRRKLPFECFGRAILPQ
jgi:ribosomal protein S18 acetylase RimI-like enzyme